MQLQPFLCVVLLSSTLLAQSSSQPPVSPRAPEAQTQPAPQQSAPARGEALAQMRNDLNRLESLNLNMSSEIEFLRDQNLQILLRTNSQMWTVVIQDLRRQIDREEQRAAEPPPHSAR